MTRCDFPLPLQYTSRKFQEAPGRCFNRIGLSSLAPPFGMKEEDRFFARLMAQCFSYPKSDNGGATLSASCSLVRGGVGESDSFLFYPELTLLLDRGSQKPSPLRRALMRLRPLWSTLALYFFPAVLLLLRLWSLTSVLYCCMPLPGCEPHTVQL